MGQCIDEQLLKLGIKDSDLDAVLLTHLDCDHANGLKQVSNAKKFLVSADELAFAQKLTNRVRYRKLGGKALILLPLIGMTLKEHFQNLMTCWVMVRLN